MKNNIQQTDLFKYRNEIKQSLSSIKIGPNRFSYLHNFLRQHNSLLFFTLLFLFLQTIFEIVLLVLVSNSLKSILNTAQSHNNLWIVILILVCSLVYIILAFVSVRYERTFVLDLINDLRRKFFTFNLNREIFDNNNETRSDFVAKISYHLSLLTMGIDNTLISGIRWALYMLILVVFGITNEGSYFYLACLVFVFSIILFFVSYIISKKIISRQVASYSRVIKHITIAMLEIPFIKNLHREKLIEKKLDKIVAVDTYFRIIRDTWIRYSNRVVFVLVIVISAIYLLLTSYYPSFSFNISTQIFIKGIFYIYALRILYSSTKAGIYFLPLRLGVFLSIPDISINTANPRAKWPFETIIFRSNKVKLFEEGEYLKKISFEFNKGGRYLFVGNYQIGKTHLATLFAGQGYFSRHSWTVKINKEHFGYNYWSEIFKDSYFFSSNFFTDSTVGEVVFGKDRENIKEEDISYINVLSKKFPIFLSIFSKTRFIGESVRSFGSSHVSLFAIQTIYCMVNKPKFIIIDNFWIDLGYKQVEEMIKILEKELPRSIIIIFSRNKNLIIQYSNIYEIKKSSIEKI